MSGKPVHVETGVFML